MLKLYYNDNLILAGGIADFLGILNQFTQARIITINKVDFFLVLVG